MAGKWISGLATDTPLEEAAQHVLNERFTTLRLALESVAESIHADAEAIHQLRVGARRARAALDIFRCCLPRKVYRRAKKQLRTLRRAAGEVRDWDVFLATITDWANHQPRGVSVESELLRGYGLAGHFQNKADLLSRIRGRELARGRAPEAIANSVRASRDRGRRRVGDVALPLARSLLDGITRRMAGALLGTSELHELRLAGKRLRYAVEVLADAIPSKFTDLVYPDAVALQELLGDINDAQIALKLLDEVQDALADAPAEALARPTALASCRHFCEETLASHRRRFHAWRRGRHALATAWPPEANQNGHAAGKIIGVRERASKCG